VENSDHLGLSQLYQLRGRVGRSNRLAYCYLTYTKNKALTELSEKRLKTIKEFTEFGSGFKVALRDLEIRGAGNVLGAQQHGQMDAVGYDMYIKLLEEAIKEKKGEETKAVINCKVDIKMNAYIPETYIENHDMRMDMYKKIAAIKTKEDASDITDELIDRFSEPPECVLNLIDISYIKALAENVGIFELTDFNLKVTFNFFDVSYLDFEKISLISEEFKDRIMINSGSVPGFTYRMYKDDMKNKSENIKKILQMLK
jgi:transcription-repair coupling factor (superfamily II helicase)